MASEPTDAQQEDTTMRPGTPPAVLARLFDAITAVVGMPAVREGLLCAGAGGRGGGGATLLSR